MPLNNEVVIVPYSPKHKESFKTLNEQWINQYFTIEEEDSRQLNDPEKYILQHGGYIFIALLDETPVGTVALARHSDTAFELCKMCVSPLAQGQKIGSILCRTAIEHAKIAGAGILVLESNKRLGSALNIYSQLGFKETPDFVSKYNRVDIRMELDLSAYNVV
ncbi:MAG: GNAT family N-acetyltransferase [Flavitalea sp.]